ncbi:MAG: glycosyltransferase family 4 protein [Patescibacteria group bacterium]|nr:glycosyltransferase family 4 protein [Patescibacteria group bacterium]
MDVAINILPLQNNHAQRGSGKYVRLLLDALKTSGKSHRYHEFISLRDIPKNVDCIHHPFFDPFFLTLPYTRDIPYIVTVHDLIPIMYPQYFPRGLKGIIKWLIQKAKLRRASAIITDSQASKQDIMKIVKMPEEKIFVIQLAPDPFFSPHPDTSVIKKYKLPNDFLLYVGDVNWNKNVPNMIRSIKYIDMPLVLVGKSFFDKSLRESIEIDTIIKSEQLQKKIIKLGFVDIHDLRALYSLARITLCISFAEGFGFSLVESMACGTPCVVSNCSSLVEIAGPSIRVNPWSIDDIVEGIRRALSMDKSIEGQKAIRWVKKFSWEDVANKTIHVYRRVI